MPLFPRSRRVAAVVVPTAVFSLGLIACSRETPPAPAPRATAPAAAPVAAAKPAPASSFADVPRDAPVVSKDERDALMRAIFGDRYRQQTGDALLALPEAQEAMGVDTFLMTLVARATLPDGRIAVVVNGAGASETGADMSAHVSSGMVNVYLLERDGGRLTLQGRHENLFTTGSEGQIGEVKWLLLGRDRPGFILYSGGIWQGYEIAIAQIVDLAGGMRRLGEFNARSDNEGACGPETAHCWNITGAIRAVRGTPAAQYDDLAVDFTGFNAALKKVGGGVEHVETPVKQKARYRFDGKAYGLIEGENPVPGI